MKVLDFQNLHISLNTHLRNTLQYYRQCVYTWIQHTYHRICISINMYINKDVYGVATICRLLEIISLCCRISSLLQGSFAKETCNFNEPTNRSHPIPIYILCTSVGRRQGENSTHLTKKTHKKRSVPLGNVYIHQHNEKNEYRWISINLCTSIGRRVPSVQTWINTHARSIVEHCRRTVKKNVCMQKMSACKKQSSACKKCLHEVSWSTVRMQTNVCIHKYRILHQIKILQDFTSTQI